MQPSFMKILQVNKFHHILGGADKYYLDVSSELTTLGHHVHNFAMHHPDNLPSEDERFFVSAKDFSLSQKSGLVHRLKESIRNATTMLWSREAVRQLDRMLTEAKPDVAHLHNIYHQLSPSILPVLKKHNVPVVMTVHDWNLVSCNYVRFHDGATCSHTLNKNFFNAIVHKCLKGSYIASFLGALMHYLHKLLRVYQKNIDTFIFPSQYFKSEHERFGFAMKHSVAVPNYIDVEKYQANTKPGDYAIVVGRVSEEKGIGDIVSALEQVPDLRIKIVGDGPDMGAIRKRVEGSDAKDRIELSGKKSHDEVIDLIAQSRFMVFASRAIENMPLCVLEAMALGKPCVASRVGGLSELVEDQKTGVLFEAGNVVELADTLNRLNTDENLIEQYGTAARAKAEATFSKEQHYQTLLSIYQEVCNP